MSDDATLDEFGGNNEESANLELGPIKIDIPSEWNLAEINNLFNIISGNNYTGDHLSEDDNGGKIFLTLKSVSKGGGFNWDSIKYYTGDVNEREMVESGDLLIANTDVTQDGDVVGYSIQVPDFNQERRVAASMDLSILRPYDDNVNISYVKYLLQAEYIHSRMRAFSAGSTVLHLNTDLAQRISLPLPPLSEQRKIATVLHTVDQAIQKTEDIIEQKQRLRQAVAQESLVIETNSYTRPTEWGETPDLWAEKPLSDVCELITDGTHMPPERTDDGIPLVGVDEIAGVQLDFTGGLSYISEEDYKRMSDSNKPNPEDVLIAVVGATIGKSCLVTREKPFAIQRSLGLLRPNDPVLPKFLHTVVQSPNFKRQLDTRSRATAQAGVYLEELKHVQIPVPSLEEQREIANKVDTITVSIRCENRLSDRLKVLKQGLMQDLLSGEVRTTDADIDIPEEIAKYG